MLTDEKHRCQAITSKGVRCRKPGKTYRIHPDDGLMYLACDQHYRQEWFRPSGKGEAPPSPEELRKWTLR